MTRTFTLISSCDILPKSRCSAGLLKALVHCMLWCVMWAMHWAVPSSDESQRKHQKLFPGLVWLSSAWLAGCSERPGGASGVKPSYKFLRRRGEEPWQDYTIMKYSDQTPNQWMNVISLGCVYIITQSGLGTSINKYSDSIYRNIAFTISDELTNRRPGSMIFYKLRGFKLYLRTWLVIFIFTVVVLIMVLLK